MIQGCLNPSLPFITFKDEDEPFSNRRLERMKMEKQNRLTLRSGIDLFVCPRAKEEKKGKREKKEKKEKATSYDVCQIKPVLSLLY